MQDCFKTPFMSFFMKYQRVSPPKPAGKVIFRRLLKKDQMQGPKSLRSEAYLEVRCNDEG